MLNKSANLANDQAEPRKHGLAVPAIESKTGRTIQSVDRALSVLEAVAEASDGATVSDISKVVGLNISTCHHLLTTLVHRGFLTHMGRMRGYALGPKLSELVDVSQGERDPSVVLADDLRKLSGQLGHTVQFAVLSDTSLMTKLTIAGNDEDIIEPNEVEKMSAFHATATGKAILAWIPDTELMRVISTNGLTAYTPKTITSLSGLVDELRLVRRRKFAVDDEEFAEGVVCIGSAIRDGGGAVIGSISATISAERASPEYRQYLSKEIVAAANAFSDRLRSFNSSLK